jgi:hypothetical protein
MSGSRALPLVTTPGPFAAIAADSGSVDRLERTNEPPHTAREVVFLWSCYVLDEQAVLDTVQSSGTLTKLPLPDAWGYKPRMDCFAYHHPQASEPGQPNNPPLPPPQRYTNGLLTHFWVDASIPLAVHLLKVRPGDKVLDLWHSTSTMAAKSIVLAQSMWLARPTQDQGIHIKTPGFLHFNDSTFGRHLLRRPSTFGCALAGTLGDYVPPEATESGNLRRIQEVPQATDSHLDFAKRLPFGSMYYDKIILDVDTVGEQIFPLERVSDQSPQETIPEMTERYRAAYVQLLLAALDAVKIGGTVVYCAPSTAHDEHDRIVFRALYHRKLVSDGIGSWIAELEALPHAIRRSLRANWAKQTRQGWLVMSTGDEGDMEFGPYYITVIHTRPRTGNPYPQGLRPPESQDGWEDIERAAVDRAFRE